MEKNKILSLFSNSATPSPEALKALLSGTADEALFAVADAVRREHVGGIVHIRAIVEFSNYCRLPCRYCGLNARNEALTRYRMAPDEIGDTVLEAARAGYKTVVLQSGEDPFYTKEILCELIRGIRKKCDIAITLSIGERDYEELKAFFEAGAERYLLKHETSDEALYAALHPGCTLKSRIECLKNIKKLGYETGSGFMIGLPGQTLETIANDILLLKELACDMAGIGPFLPSPATPLGGEQPGDPLLTRRAVALTRLLLPQSHLPATTSLGVLSRGERDEVFSSGANVIMKKVTPWNVRRLYEIYPSDLGEEKTILTAHRELEELIRGLGKIPV